MNKVIQLVMNPNKNPLIFPPTAQRFQVMVVLSTMWTAIVTASLGAWALYGILWAGHVMVLLGALITAKVFQDASRRLTLIYHDYPREDGTPRYDDVWGA